MKSMHASGGFSRSWGAFITRGRTDRLEAGMVFALEPKMLLPGEFAVGIESVFAVTGDAAEQSAG